ncbi:MAG: hypothetical protein F6J97_16495 [Leptolyngbya sp. SIO4C1]|nr:hypothetical protein [Leptolyngbya sp. SIO4C1]
MASNSGSEQLSQGLPGRRISGGSRYRQVSQPRTWQRIYHSNEPASMWLYCAAK